MKHAAVTKRPLLTTGVLMIAVLAAGCPSYTLAGCHCFKNRTFDPSQPSSADLYVLAAARNSLLAAASGTARNSVIKRRMTGASETDLWLSLYYRSDWGRQDRDTPSFKAACKDNDRDAMAAALADGALKRTFRTEQQVLSRIRSAGADTSEITLSLLVSSRTRPDPMEVFKQVRSGKTTWGKTLDSIGISPDSTGDFIAEQVNRARKISSGF